MFGCIVRRTPTGAAAFLSKSACAVLVVASCLPAASPPAVAQPGAGAPAGLQGNSKSAGVTITQATGLTGVIYLRAVPQVNPQGEYLGDRLELFNNNVNTKMKWIVRFDLPAGRHFVGLSVSANTTGANVSPATADSWNGITMIDTVSIAPWSMNRVLQQCEQHLQKPDGTYKSSAVFNLQPNLTERVRAEGHCRVPGAPTSNTESFSAQAMPRTRLTAYVLDARSGQRPGVSGFSQETQQATGSGALLPTRRPGLQRPLEHGSQRPGSTRLQQSRFPQFRLPKRTGTTGQGGAAVRNPGNSFGRLTTRRPTMTSEGNISGPSSTGRLTRDRPMPRTQLRFRQQASGSQRSQQSKIGR